MNDSPIRQRLGMARTAEGDAPTSPGSGDAPTADQEAAAQAARQAKHEAEGALFDNFEDGLESAATLPSREEQAAEDEKNRQIEAIRDEGLNARRLRIIRRVAQVHNLTFENSYEALWKLRKEGIDPFSPEKSADEIREDLAEDGQPPTALPQRSRANLPSTEVRHEEIRLNDIRLIQRDIVRRRQRRLMLLLTRLTIFVFLPTLIAFFYFRDIASKLYETESQFIIQLAAPPGATAAAAASPLVTAQDSMNVQAYLQSRDAMLRLDSDLGFRSHFSQPQIDPLQRLEIDSTQEETYKTYKRMVKIGFDPTDGIVKLRVSATDPATSKAFSEALLRYSEEQVDHLTERLREDQMKGARELYDQAEQKMLAAQENLIDLQKRVGSINPEAQGEAVSERITLYEDQIQKKKLELASLLDNPLPNAARVDGVKTDIARLEQVLSDLRREVSAPGIDNQSLADLNSEVKRAELELETRVKMLQQSLTNLESARIEADRQVRYLSVNVLPIAPDEPNYPKVPENTILTFLILMGIYLLISLTAAILREQVSA